jgi:hypothetical protein
VTHVAVISSGMFVYESMQKKAERFLSFEASLESDSDDEREEDEKAEITQV